MVTLRDIEQAMPIVQAVAHHTPVVTNAGISRRVAPEAQLLFKAENLQRTGSFKIRGGTYRLSQLTQSERTRGVAAASAGNHAQGVALAAHNLGVAATIFMPGVRVHRKN